MIIILIRIVALIHITIKIADSIDDIHSLLSITFLRIIRIILKANIIFSVFQSITIIRTHPLLIWFWLTNRLMLVRLSCLMNLIMVLSVISLTSYFIILKFSRITQLIFIITTYVSIKLVFLILLIFFSILLFILLILIPILKLPCIWALFYLFLEEEKNM